MKIICLQKNIKQGIFATNHITGKNVNLPILNNILITAKDNIIKLTSTNLEIGINSIIRGKVETNGSFTVDAKIFTEYITNLLPNKKIQLSVENDNLIINSENYTTKIKGQSAEEYPLIPKVAKDNSFNLKISDFKNALAQVIFAVSQDENRPALTGVLFSVQGDTLTLVATDSYRLAEKKIKLNNSGHDVKIIIPTRTLQEVQRIISGDFSDNKDVGEINVYINENQILFNIDNVEIVSRLIEDQYPDYKQIIPNEYKTTCLVDRSELLRAIKASAIFSKSGINDINLDFLQAKNNLMVSAVSGQTGENITNIDGKITGNDNSITINSYYLLDGINHLDSDMAQISLVDNNLPCLINTPSKDSGYLYIVMPIKK